MKIFTAILFLVILSGTAQAKKVHSIFFEGTDYELNVYKVYGKEPGKTILLIGGIQGDEPGGFLSADLYADMALSKGNLIVVPRANFHSILLNQRQVNEDMNRKFAEDSKLNYEARVVGILKSLIAESDCLLNLHDGSGFYSDTWISDDRNPKRYGQSIIADCENYEKQDKTSVIKLGEIGREVTKEINKKINKKDYYFHFNNHNTASEKSIHKVQRKSATYYALTKCGIPAFGVETSKSLPLELKIRHHVLAINAFMERYEIIPEHPYVNLEKPTLQYLVVSVNGSLPVVVNNGQTLSIKPADKINIVHIEGNFERGLSADILGIGSVNDVGKSIGINKPTRIVVKKDSYPCGNVFLSLNGRANSKESYAVVDTKGGAYLLYKLKVNGVFRIIENFGSISIVKGDTLEIEDVITTAWDPSGLVVNFKGYVGNSSVNTGEDRGYVIKTATDLWPNYSLSKKKEKYQVITTTNGSEIGKFFVEIEKPAVDYLVIKNGDGLLKCYKDGQNINFKNSLQQISLLVFDVISNVQSRSEIDVKMSGANGLMLDVEIGKPIDIKLIGEDGQPFYTRMEISRYGKLMGSVSLNQLPAGDGRRIGTDEQI